MANDFGPSGELNPIEEQAFALSRVAILLDTARQTGNRADLAGALEEDLELWVAIRTLAESPHVTMGPEVKNNLIRLSHFVAETVLSNGVEMASKTLDTLINVNLQICEGLLEASRRR